MRYRDFEEFLDAFDARGVRYLVIGGHAVGFHARPRATKDLDIYIDATPANARRVLAALGDFFGGKPPGYTVPDLLDPDIILQLGVAPVRIDIISRLKGVRSFRGAWHRRVDARFGTAKTHYLSLEDLIASKRATGRPQDLADLEVLQAVKDLQGGARRRRGR